MTMKSTAQRYLNKIEYISLRLFSCQLFRYLRNGRYKEKLILIAVLFLSVCLSGCFTEQYQASFEQTGWGSVAWGDYDNDGFLEIILTGCDDYFTPVSKIYKYVTGGFNQVCQGNLTPVCMSAVAWGDYNNDGFLDIVLTGDTTGSGTQPVSKIYKCVGNGFVEVYQGDLAPVCNSAVAWGDYNNDGLSDILLAGTNTSLASPNVAKIYQNTGNGFAEVFPGSLTPVQSPSLAWVDYDNDGLLDIFLTGKSSSGLISKIYRNTGNGFTAVLNGSLPGVESSSVDWGDYDNDGFLDIVMTGSAPGNISKIYKNQQGTGFLEVFAGSLIPVHQSSVAWGDYNNDGSLDLFLTGCQTYCVRYSKAYQNTPFWFYELIPALGGNFTTVGNGSVAWGDYDNDNDLDVLLTGCADFDMVTKIYRNEVSSPNTPPAAPSGLTHSISGNTVTLTWNRSTDAQTPQDGLTYNLRMGGGTIGIATISPLADVYTGHRRVARMGNVNEVTSYTVKNLPPGTYCWSVQAIDSAFAGSPFAPNDCFNIPNNCVNPPPGMRAWWPLDESGAFTSAWDIAGASNNLGAYFGSPTPIQAKVLLGLRFDGLDDYLQVADQSEINLGIGDFTIDMWLQTTDNETLETIIDKRTKSASGSYNGYTFYLSDGNIGLQLADGTYRNYNSTAYVADGNWHHVAVTVSRTDTNGIRFYRDGAYVSQDDPTDHAGSLDNTSPLRIGSHSFEVSTLFHGVLDEVELFGRALTEQEIYNIYKVDSSGKCKVLP